MHVLVIPSWYPANAADIRGVFFRDQAIALRRSGAKVTVLAPQLVSLREGAASDAPRFAVESGVETYRPAGRNWGGRIHAWRQWKFRSMVRRTLPQLLAESGRPDIVQVQSAYPAGGAALELLHRHGLPYVVCEHSSAFVRRSYTPSQFKYVSAAVGSARAIFAVSTPFASVLSSCLPSTAGKWGIIPNAVGDEFFAAPMRVPNSRRNRLVSVGALEPKKGFDLLLRAFGLLSKEDSTVTLEVIGDGSMRTRLVKLAEELSCSARITFHGRLDRARTVETVRQCDVFVSPSRVETFGIAVAEALALGIPAVVTPFGGPSSFVGAEDGLVVDEISSEALHQGMSAMLRASPTAYDPGAIRKRCYSRFSSASVARLTLNSFARALSGNEDP